MRVLVLGDPILDLSRYGTRVRKSPETSGCWVVEETHREWGLGGAANVARWLAVQPEHEVTLVAPHGRDWASGVLRDLCQAAGVRLSMRLFDPALSVTMKERVIVEDAEKGRCQQLLRLDQDVMGTPRETDLPPLQHELWTRGRYDAVVAVDYGKFVFRGESGARLIAMLLEMAETPLFINSKYPGGWTGTTVRSRAEFVVCNQQEMVNSLGTHDPRIAWGRMASRYFVVTKGAGGVTAVREAEAIHRLAPATEAVDVVGCGDAFLGGLVHAAARFSWASLQRLKPVELVDLLDEGQRFAAHCLGQVGCGNPLVASEVTHG